MERITEGTIEELNMKLREITSDLENSETEKQDLISRIDILETRMKERDSISEALLQGERITGTTDATPETETTHTHTLGKIPTIVFITNKSNGVVYLTDKNSASIKVEGSAASLDFVAYLLIWQINNNIV